MNVARSSVTQPAAEAPCPDEAYFRSLIENASDIITILEPNGMIRYESPSIEGVLGYKPDELVGCNAFEFIHPDDVAGIQIIFQESLNESGTVRRCEFRFRHKDRTWRVFEAIGKNLLHDPAVHGIIVVSRDITGRKEAEEVLRQSEVKFRGIFTDAPTGIVRASPEGRFIQVNPAFCELLGYSEQELLTKTGRDVTHPDDREWSADARRQIWHAEKPTIRSYEKRYVRKDGQVAWVRISITLIRDARGQASYSIAHVIDITEQKKAEEVLRQSEERFSITFEQAPIGMALGALDGRWLKANQAMCELVGYTAEELSHMTFRDITHPEDVQACLDHLPELSAGKLHTYRLEKRYLHKCGRVIWASVSVSLVRDANGRPLHAIVQSQDITERKQAEERLRLQSTALEAAANAVVITNRTGSILWTNPAFTQLTGYSADEALGKNLRILKSGAHGQDFYRNLWETVISGQVWRGDMINRRKDGTLYNEEMTIAPVRNERGEVTNFIAIKQDVTGRKQTERALRESEELFRSLSASSPLGIFLTDTRGQVTYINPRSRQILCCSLIESQNDGWVKCIHPDDREAAWQHWLDYVRSGAGEYSYEYRIQNPDGTTRFVHMRAAPLRSDESVPMGFVGSIEDITHHRRAEDELRESKRNLERALKELQAAHDQVVQQERLRALGTMASGIAHDFNNALAAILGFTELLCHRPENLADTKKTLRYLQMMNTAAQDAGIVVNRLREFYRQREEGEVFGAVDLNKLIEGAVSLTQPKWKNQAEARGVGIRFAMELGQIPSVIGSEADLREALTNLIFNAVDAMPQGGTITVRTRSVNSRVIMEVADTGTGMTEEVRQRCLEPFFTTKGKRGTGLGLSMVYGTVQRHQGSIEIDSGLGKGTTFRLSLPAAQESPPTANRDSTTENIRPLRVLLVDDEDIVRQILREYLVGDGHTVETAPNGRDALDKMPKAAFDVVILDRAMPGLSGDQVAVAIKEFKPDLPVILLTGFGNMMQAAGETPPGIDLVLGKPVTIAGLRAALAQVVRSR
jgi:nitrogen fixation negative regulator NifL